MKALKLGLKLAAVAGLSTLLSVSAYAGIENSKHDLRGTATGGGVKIDNATEICAFCHTPHGASADTTAPLWNRVVASDQTAYSTATLDGTVVLAESPSLACLSCHDGQQAMNTVINAPSTAAAVGTPSNYNYVSDGIAFVGTSDKFMVGGDGVGLSGVAFLGTDLTNDHPVALPYAGGGITTADKATVNTTLMADPDFKTTNLMVDEIGGATAWWIETGGNATRSKTDLILYARDATNVGYVECATCHDPHNGPAAGAPVQAFLRMSNNDGSQVCLACHNK